MPAANLFVREVKELATTITGYRVGKSGQRGLCDCIGLVMGAMARLNGSAYPMHSTNYFARYEMQSLRALKGETEKLLPGQLLYKARSDTGRLNARYQPGGRYYTGDMLDYYHVGVVTSVLPLEITHCTSDESGGGIRRDSSARSWTHVGELVGVDYDAEPVEEVTTMRRTARVSVPKGTSTVNLRQRPSKSAALLKRIASGTAVEVLEQADGWAKIADPQGDRGYVMTDFLKMAEADEQQGEAAMPENAADGNEEITLSLPPDAAEALYEALVRAGAGMV